MQRKNLLFLLFTGFIFCIFITTPVSAQIQVVSTTSVLWEPIQYIGGENVAAIYIADPTICPHMQGEVINNRIQLEREFIASSDLFVAHNGSVDNPHVIPYVEEFMLANGYGEVEWTFLSDPAMTWNTPEMAIQLASEIEGWLCEADPDSCPIYKTRTQDYIGLINAADLSPEESARTSGQDVIVMIWQKDAAEGWLGLKIVGIFAPEFYMGGKYTPAKLVDDITKNPEKYQNVQYIIENMQSGELGKGIEEALNDRGIFAERVIFTNFPKSIPGVETIPDVLIHNKETVMPEDEAVTSTATAPQEASLGYLSAIGALFLVVLMISYRK